MGGLKITMHFLPRRRGSAMQFAATMPILAVALTALCCCTYERDRSASALATLLSTRFPSRYGNRMNLYFRAGKFAYDYEMREETEQNSHNRIDASKVYSQTIQEENKQRPALPSDSNVRTAPVVYGVVHLMQQIAYTFSESSRADLHFVENLLLWVATPELLLAPGMSACERIADGIPFEKPCVSLLLRTSVFKMLSGCSSQWPGASSAALRVLAPYLENRDRSGELIVEAIHGVGPGVLQAQTLLAALHAKSSLASAIADRMNPVELGRVFALPHFTPAVLGSVLDNDSVSYLYGTLKTTRKYLQKQLAALFPQYSDFPPVKLDLPSIFTACAEYAGNFSDIEVLAGALIALRYADDQDVSHMAIRAALERPAAPCAVDLYLEATESADEALCKLIRNRLYPFDNLPRVENEAVSFFPKLLKRRRSFDYAFVDVVQALQFMSGVAATPYGLFE